MAETLILDLQSWWSTLSTEFRFLFALPFAVGAAALASDAWRHWRDERRR